MDHNISIKPYLGLSPVKRDVAVSSMTLSAGGSHRQRVDMTAFIELRDSLRDLCQDGGEFGPGDRFLTERETAERFAVSRPTANKALAALVGEGLLEFRRGVGTFVRLDRLDLDLRSMLSFTEKCLAAGYEPTTKVTAFRSTTARTAGEEIANALEVGPRERLWAMTRVRSADGDPVALERRYIVRSQCEDLTRADAKGSLIGLLEDYYELELGGVDQRLAAVNAKVDEAALLAAPRGTACVELRAIGRLTDGRSLWHERTLYRGDAWAFCGRSAGPGSGKPAVAEFIEE